MSFISALAFLASFGGDATVPCPARDDIVFHAPPLCQYVREITPKAVGVTFRASLNPLPSSQQVALFRSEGTWYLEIHGYRWDLEGGLFETRRRTIGIEEDVARRLLALAPRTKIAELSTRPYYGDADTICLDGSTLSVALAEATSGSGQLTKAERHSCSDDQSIDAIASAFRRAALTADPEFDGFLSGLGR